MTRARSRLVQERVCGVVEVDTLLSSPRQSVVALSTLHVLATESWNSTQCRVSSEVTATTHLLLVGGVCPVSMLVPDSGVGMGPGVCSAGGRRPGTRSSEATTGIFFQR